MDCPSSPTLASRRPFKRLRWILPALALTACGSELPEVTEVYSLRVLAIQADPPEVAPGESTRIRALVVDPEGNGRALDWVVALCTPDLVNGGCLEYTSLLASYSEEDAQLEYAKCCVRGDTLTPEDPTIELDPTQLQLTTAASMLQGLDDASAESGLNAQLNLLMCESGVCSSLAEDASSTDSPESISLSLPPDQSALAIKRVRVSTATPNQNPSIDQLTADGDAHSDGVPLTVVPGQTYALKAILEAEAIETYTNVLDDGSVETVTEQPYISWYATEGLFDDPYSDPLDDTEGVRYWTAPSEPEAAEGGIYAVIWDRRGGVSWRWMRVLF